MKPLNSSHLILKDIKSVKDRYHKECISQNMTVRNLSAKAVSHTEGDKVFELDVDSEGNGLVALDPCFAYTIWLTATVGDKNHSVRFCDVISQKSHYNIPTLEGYPYNNELKSEVVDNMCRISEENIMIPDPPNSIKSCVFTSGTTAFVSRPGYKSNNSSQQVEFEIVDPSSDLQNPQRICIRTSIPQVKNCSNKLASLEAMLFQNWDFLTNQTKTHKLADTIYRFHNVHIDMCRKKNSSNYENVEVIKNSSSGDTLVSALTGAFVASVIFGCIMCLCFIKMLKFSLQRENVKEEQSVRMNEIVSSLNRSPYMDAGEYVDGEYVDSGASSTSEKFKSHGMMTKEQAAHLLRGKPEGSWIRRQNESGEERISVLKGDKVQHVTLHQHQIGGASLWCTHTKPPPVPLNNLIDDYITKGLLGNQIIEV